MKRIDRSTALLGVVIAVGCDVFDPSLYEQTASAGVTLADRCETSASVPRVLPSPTNLVRVDTAPLGDHYREFAGCAGNDLPGNDGFFSVAMRRGETWHFHVDPLSADGDPALYVLPNCATLQCSPAGASDLCGPGRSEHFSYRPITDGVHLVGIDSKARGGAAYGVTVVRPVCGDGVVEHGEPCDDGLPTSGVVCERCHKVLSRPMATEMGVANDDYVNAMSLRPEGGLAMFPVIGTLGVCDVDMFGFEAAEGMTVRVSLRPSAGTSCPAGVTLALLRSDAVTPPALTAVPAAVAEATTESRDGCPTVTLARATRGATWFARVGAGATATVEFAYQLTVDAQRP